MISRSLGSQPIGDHASLPHIIVVESAYGFEHNVFEGKLREVIERQGWTFEFWGWSRSPAERERKVPYPRRLLQATNRQSRPLLAIDYLLWMWKVGRASLRSRKDALFVCSRFDAAFPLAVASLFQAKRFLFANRDNISSSYAWPKLVKKLLMILETWVASRATLHLVPGSLRWNGNAGNLRVIPNTPTRALLARAQAIARQSSQTRRAPLVLYLNGWLTETRGISTLLCALKSPSLQGRVEVWVAGDNRCPEGQELLELESVKNFGILSADEALALYFAADLAFTYYDPRLEINRLAEPNKWGDCVATLTPFVANSEIITVKPFRERGACFTLDYRDADGLSRLLCRLVENPGELADARQAISEFDFPPWDDAMTAALQDALTKK